MGGFSDLGRLLRTIPFFSLKTRPGAYMSRLTVAAMLENPQEKGWGAEWVFTGVFVGVLKGRGLDLFRSLVRCPQNVFFSPPIS